MVCHIIKDKQTGDEYLIPGCMSVTHNMQNNTVYFDGIEMTDRDIIKAYCTCHRAKVEKYEVHTRDEVIVMINKVEKKIDYHKSQLSILENELDCIKSEVFMLNTVVVFDSTKL